MLVGINADDRLQQRRADLVGQRDRADLRETQVKFALEQRIDGDDQRLHHVVEEMREADGAQHIEARLHAAGAIAANPQRNFLPCNSSMQLSRAVLPY